jgi:hypothetical protein
MPTAAARETYHPSPRSPHTVRLAEDTKASMKQAVEAGQAVTVNTWGEQVLEAALGFVRCHRGNCPGKTPPIPVTFGDLAGMTFGEAAAQAVEVAESQHPRHEPVTIGAARSRTVPAAPAPLLRARARTRPGAAVFMEPGSEPHITPVPEVPVRSKKGRVRA